MSGVRPDAQKTPEEPHRRRNALALFFVAVFILAILASVSLSSPFPKNSTTTSIQCLSSNEAFTVTTTVTKNFQNCVPAESIQRYTFSVAGSGIFTLNGTIDSEFPIDVQIMEGAFVGGVPYSEVLYGLNDTTSAYFSNIHVLPDQSYNVDITNIGRNNSLSASLQFSLD